MAELDQLTHDPHVDPLTGVPMRRKVRPPEPTQADVLAQAIASLANMLATSHEKLASTLSQANQNPVTVEAVLPSSPAPIVHFTGQDMKGATWEVTIPGLNGAPARTMTIKRTG